MSKKPEVEIRARALKILARRDHSRAELRGKLLSSIQTEEKSEQYEYVDLDAVLDDLTRRGLLSDERTASQLVHVKRKRFGTQRIVHELRQKGIPETLIDAATPELKASELESARQIWQKKFGTLPQDVREKARQMRFLQSRGFGLEICLKVLSNQRAS